MSQSAAQNASEEALQKLKDSAATGDFASFKKEFQQWEQIADLSSYEPTISERIGALRYHTSSKTLPLQRVLGVAAKEGHVEIVGFLLDQGCNITAPAVRWAMSRKRWSVLELYLERGWDINTAMEGGNTLPVLKEILPSTEHVRWCLEHGADPTFVSAGGNNDIPSFAGRTGTVETLQLLREHGVDFTKCNALPSAAGGRYPGRIDVMAYLLDDVGVPVNQYVWGYDDNKFDKNKTSVTGTALHAAVRAKCLDNVKFLLERDIDRDLKNVGGSRAVDLAREEGMEQVLALFED